jgi:hypothetical protein
MQQRHYSHRAGPIDRCTLCLLYRANPEKYRHRRGMLGPLLKMLLGIPERRSNYRRYRDYDPNLSRRRRRRTTTTTRVAHVAAERPMTLAEKHAAEFRQHIGPVTPPVSEGTVPAAAPSRRFEEPRPATRGVRSNVTARPRGRQKYQPFPPPPGQPPYHLSLDDLLPADQMAAIRNSGRILMHVAGDTGGVKAPQSQQIVAMAMETQFQFPDVTLRPAFFYHLGDVVYYYGEAKEYYSQFYDPYVHYPAPIFAIPGNHDGDVADSSTPSLTAFVDNFCATTPHTTPEAGETARDAMTQPNVYWTLEAPFVTMIGLYSNVPEGGEMDDDQINWFVNELRTAPPDKALIVSVHHPAYSADSHHSGSRYIQETLDHSFSEAGRLPDLVLTGHVHNYQRFTREIEGRHLPYIVHGSGGYWHLHYLAKKEDGSPMTFPYQMPDNPDVTLEQACDDRHSFMRLMVTPRFLTGECWTVSRPQESWRAPATRLDGFALDLQSHRLVRGTAMR